jgi:hypothetical protein
MLVHHADEHFAADVGGHDTQHNTQTLHSTHQNPAPRG